MSEDSSLLRHYTVSTVTHLSTFRMIVLPAYLGSWTLRRTKKSLPSFEASITVYQWFNTTRRLESSASAL